MIDIHFYQKVFELKQRLMRGESLDKQTVFNTFAKYRREHPVIFNIETTNACNMRCVMCPRTTLMTRPIANLDMATFRKVLREIRPWTMEEWAEWQSFAESKYHIKRNEMSENHFFLHILPKVIVMHGYGEPLLDKHITRRISLLTEKNIPSYFSCNPSNAKIGPMTELFKNGLGYLKFSIESTDDSVHKQIRGHASNFTSSYKKIVDLLDIRDACGAKTTIVITMINLSREKQYEEFERLKELFRGADVYIYLKTQDELWYQNIEQKATSLHWTECCQFPWTSMTLKSDGHVSTCGEDYNNEVILGDARKESLHEIWNGEAYQQFRLGHFNGTIQRCAEKCDMKLIGEMNLIGEFHG